MHIVVAVEEEVQRRFEWVSYCSSRFVEGDLVEVRIRCHSHCRWYFDIHQVEDSPAAADTPLRQIEGIHLVVWRHRYSHLVDIQVEVQPGSLGHPIRSTEQRS